MAVLWNELEVVFSWPCYRAQKGQIRKRNFWLSPFFSSANRPLGKERDDPVQKASERQATSIDREK